VLILFLWIYHGSFQIFAAGDKEMNGYTQDDRSEHKHNDLYYREGNGHNSSEF
jgi:hypothetical protein